MQSTNGKHHLFKKSTLCARVPLSDCRQSNELTNWNKTWSFKVRGCSTFRFFPWKQGLGWKTNETIWMRSWFQGFPCTSSVSGTQRRWIEASIHLSWVSFVVGCITFRPCTDLGSFQCSKGWTVWELRYEWEDIDRLNKLKEENRFVGLTQRIFHACPVQAVFPNMDGMPFNLKLPGFIVNLKDLVAF